MLKQHKQIRQGDLVVVYESFNRMKAVWVEEGAYYNARFGIFPHKDWIGKPYGCKVTCVGRKSGYIYLLAPTPEIWTQVLKHRTQILYMADISMICAQLELKPGSIVLESGTGSGSLTTSLARGVAPSGKVHTFEFHKQRVEEASQEFQRNGLDQWVSVNHRNIEELGFPEYLFGTADGVFLDLPKPWLVVESARDCLLQDGRFCSFSPQIEQVQRTCEALHHGGFRDIRTFECLLRPYEVMRERIITNVQQVQALDPFQKGHKTRRPTDSEMKGQSQNSNIDTDSVIQRLSAKPVLQTRGHTGFLTFARKLLGCSNQDGVRS